MAELPPHRLGNTATMVRNSLAMLLVSVNLTACQQATSPAAQHRTEDEEIEEFCNSIAAELVANPNSTAPLRRLQQRHLEEEWNFEKVDRICSSAIARKTALLYGTSTKEN